MGEASARACSLPPVVLGRIARGATSAVDTRDAARDLAQAGADLILFAGGDGTARDVFDVVGDGIPILGIPTGVKMHSAVFATTPENAGDLAAMCCGPDAVRVRFREAEVMDIDEDTARRGGVSARLYGYARTPYERALMQSAKAGSGLAEEAELDALCRSLVAGMEDGCLYIVGPGTTTKRLLRLLDLEGTLLGVDAVLDGRLVGRDLAEQDLLGWLRGRRARIIVSVIGGQGCLFGRGNQQISAEVVRRVGKDNIIVVATSSKIVALDRRSLFVDTDDPAVNRLLTGYIAVHTGPGQRTMLKVCG
jgi:predicted polyphosphate/ATP-dependent NAD kinase